MDYEEIMEECWGPPFAHECGHALMAVLQDIPCQGIYFERGSGRFCALSMPNTERPARRDYLYSASGVAAEKIIYPSRNSDGADADRAAFDFANSLVFEETVNEALVILAKKAETLNALILGLKAKVRSVDFDLSQLPEVSMGGSESRFLVLMNQEDLEKIVNQVKN